jgi:hypothetical protein
MPRPYTSPRAAISPTRRRRTDASLDVAQRLYASLGFRMIPPYYEVPPEILRRSVFMEAALDA